MKFSTNEDSKKSEKDVQISFTYPNQSRCTSQPIEIRAGIQTLLLSQPLDIGF